MALCRGRRKRLPFKAELIFVWLTPVFVGAVFYEMFFIKLIFIPPEAIFLKPNFRATDKGNVKPLRPPLSIAMHK